MGKMDAFYAHTALPPAPWEPLAQHLAEVAELAEQFAGRFDAAQWGALAGRWHDLGKYSEKFQRYLEAASRSPTGKAGYTVDHKTAGAKHARQLPGPLGTLLAYIIAGHHGGLPDGVDLRERLQSEPDPWQEVCPAFLKEGDLTNPPLKPSTDAALYGFQVGFFLRLVFSCLVDADCLCTERFMSPEKAAHRTPWPEDILEQMERALERRLDAFGPPRCPVDEERLGVRRACESAAALEPGFFDLTVPTGGGKTLSSLLFALRHARRYGLRQVVYAIPYTSIIEQNADEFRKVFKELSASLGRDVVIEHHSNLRSDKEKKSEEQETQNRLAMEIWDAPLVVTTNVQLFESLFARRTSACRKLHRLTKSVVILDEAQALPVGLLRPILAALRCLVQDYGSSVVLCTATQPALERREGFDPGILAEAIRPIVSDRTRLYEKLRRTEVRSLGALDNTALQARVRNERGALVVVNTTKAAREFYDCLDADTFRFHLSARMCPDHRRVELAVVKARLAAGQAVFLVSTQLIEAGVDVSFPAVYRAECGLDSLAQAAGRCNRNGELRDENGSPIPGRVYYFRHTGYEIPSNLVDLRDADADASQILSRYEHDLLSLEATDHYFRNHIWSVGQRTNHWDEPDVMKCFPPPAGKDWALGLEFEKAAERFQMIPEATHSVVVPWEQNGKVLCDEFRALDKQYKSPTRELYREAQRFTVQVYEHEWKQMTRLQRVEPLCNDSIYVLVCPENDYDKNFGLRPPGGPDVPGATVL